MTAFLIDCALKGSIVMAVALLAAWMLRRKSAATRHWVLSAGLLCAALVPVWSLVLPAIEVPMGKELPPPAFSHSLPAEEVPRDEGVFVPFEVESAGTAQPVEAKSPDDIVPWIWVTGASACLSFLLAGIVRLAWIGYRSEQMNCETWHRVARCISSDYGLRRRFRLLRSQKRSMLATWGFLKPDVILPADSANWQQDRIEIVLAHEFAHVRRSDWLIQMLARTACALYWFNPLVWIACRKLDVECEQACDDAVLRRGVTGTQYATHLLELAKLFKRKRDWTPALSMARRSTLERRFRSMLTPGLNRGTVSRASVLATIALFLVTLPMAALRAASPTPLPLPLVNLPAIGGIAAAMPVISALPVQALPPPPQGMASIEGTVVRADSGAPLPNATIELQTSLSGPKRSPYETVTDAIGRFAFPSVGPGKYRIVATTYTAGYVTTAYGKNTANPAGSAIPIIAGQRLKDLKIAMTPTASITGRVIDRDGEPVPRAQVWAMRPSYRDGKKVLQLIQAIPANDLGEYRLFWLPPGTYYISAKPENPEQSGSTSYVILPGMEWNYDVVTSPTIVHRPLENGGVAEDVYVPVYYPGAVDPRNAKPIELRPGQSMGGMQLDISGGRLSAHHIKGIVTDGASGKPAPYTRINVVSPNPGSISFAPSTLTDAAGRFDIPGVAAGPYYLAARLFVPNPSRAGGLLTDRSAYPGFLPIEVGNSDLENVRLTVGPAVSVSGRVTVEGRAAIANDPDFAKVTITATHDPQSAALMEFQANPLFQGQLLEGMFSMDISPGRYRWRISGLPDHLYVKSMRLGATDLLAEPVLLLSKPQVQVEVVVGADAAAITGRAVNAKREAALDATVVLVPDAPRRARQDLYKVATADASGNFQFQGVEPGGYKIFAWEDIEPQIWLDADFMLPLESRGRAIQVNANARATADVSVLSR